MKVDGQFLGIHLRISCTGHKSLCYACRSEESQSTQHIGLNTTRPACLTKNHINLHYRLISHYCSPDCAGCSWVLYRWIVCPRRDSTQVISVAHSWC